MCRKHARSLANFTRNFLLGQLLNIILHQLLPDCPQLLLDALVSALQAWRIPRAVKRLATKASPALPPAPPRKPRKRQKRSP